MAAIVKKSLADQGSCYKKEKTHVQDEHPATEEFFSNRRFCLCVTVRVNPLAAGFKMKSRWKELLQEAF